MSYIVRGADMPQNCRECPFREIQPYMMYCTVGKFTVSYEAAEHRAKGCPLSSIGRPQEGEKWE